MFVVWQGNLSRVVTVSELSDAFLQVVSASALTTTVLSPQPTPVIYSLQS